MNHRIDLTGTAKPLVGNNPFSGLSSEGLSSLPSAPAGPVNSSLKSLKRGRVDIRRETAGRGGKTVTTLRGLELLPATEQSHLLKLFKTTLSTGAAIKEDVWIFQGDQRDPLTKLLQEQGYRVVLAGG